jgi:hypothetical protein
MCISQWLINMIDHQKEPNEIFWLWIMKKKDANVFGRKNNYSLNKNNFILSEIIFCKCFIQQNNLDQRERFFNGKLIPNNSILSFM